MTSTAPKRCVGHVLAAKNQRLSRPIGTQEFSIEKQKQNREARPLSLSSDTVSLTLYPFWFVRERSKVQGYDQRWALARSRPPARLALSLSLFLCLTRRSALAILLLL